MKGFSCFYLFPPSLSVAEENMLIARETDLREEFD